MMNLFKLYYGDNLCSVVLAEDTDTAVRVLEKAFSDLYGR